jgi:hypothetical protein
MANLGSTLDLGDPSDWCDSRCERCPMLPGCAIGQTMARRRAAQARGEGDAPEDWRAIVEDLERSCEQSLELLAEACEREGIELAGPHSEQPKPAILEAAQRLGDELAASAMVLADFALAAGAPHDDEDLAMLIAGSALVAVKTTRIAWDSADEPRADDQRPQSWAAIVLLIEHTSQRVLDAASRLARSTPPAVWTRFDAARREHEQLWLPWLAHVSEEARVTVAALVNAGHAPSPFCRTDDDTTFGPWARMAIG